MNTKVETRAVPTLKIEGLVYDPEGWHFGGQWLSEAYPAIELCHKEASRLLGMTDTKATYNLDAYDSRQFELFENDIGSKVKHIQVVGLAKTADGCTFLVLAPKRRANSAPLVSVVDGLYDEFMFWINKYALPFYIVATKQSINDNDNDYLLRSPLMYMSDGVWIACGSNEATGKFANKMYDKMYAYDGFLWSLCEDGIERVFGKTPYGAGLLRISVADHKIGNALLLGKSPIAGFVKVKRSNIVLTTDMTSVVLRLLELTDSKLYVSAEWFTGDGKPCSKNQ